MTSQESTTSRLLTIAPEVRNVILTFFAEVRKIDGTLLEITPRQYHLLRFRFSKLILNRQLHQELLPLYYGLNVFCFTAYHRVITTDPRDIARDESISVSQRAAIDIVDWQGPAVPTRSLVKYGKHLSTKRTVFSEPAGYALELPPYHLRKLIRTMTLSIPVPPPTIVSKRQRHSMVDFKEVSVELHDWTYPVRALKALGFTGVKALMVELRLWKDCPDKQVRKAMGEAMGWFEEKMKEWGMKDGLEVEVTTVWVDRVTNMGW